jgi:hypothetical protein
VRVALPHEERRRGLEDLDGLGQLDVLTLELGYAPVLPVHKRHHLTVIGARFTHPPTQRPNRDPDLLGDMPSSRRLTTEAL